MTSSQASPGDLSPGGLKAAAPATSGTVATAAPPRAWAGLALLALPTVLLGLDLTLLHLALPALAEDLQPSSTQALWIMDAYGFMIAGFLITMGTLGDRIGRRRLLMIGAGAFAAASVLAAFSTSPAMLILARAALGVAGATLMPSTLALISNLFPLQRSAPWRSGSGRPCSRSGWPPARSSAGFCWIASGGAPPSWSRCR